MREPGMRRRRGFSGEPPSSMRKVPRTARCTISAGMASFAPGTIAAASSGGMESGTSYCATTMPVAVRRRRWRADTLTQAPTERPAAPIAATKGAKSAAGFGVRAGGCTAVPGSKPMATVTPSPGGRSPDSTRNVATPPSTAGPWIGHSAVDPENPV